MRGEIKKLLVDLDEEGLVAEVKKKLESGANPTDIIAECQDGMVEIGELFSRQEMFVSDLMMSAMIFKEVSEVVEPYLAKDDDKKALGKVVLGTVKDDIHDIGKDIVGTMLKSNNFEVVDLGVDVEPEAFVQAVRESGAKVVALSCLLASCYTSIKATVEAFQDAGIRDDVKVIIGGGPVDQHVVTFSGADTFGPDAQGAVKYCREVLC